MSAFGHPAIINNLGLELLLIEDPSTVLNLTEDRSSLETWAHDSFYRHVRLTSQYSNLKKTLEKADREFDKVAELCGSLVVRHNWALYRSGSPDDTTNNSMLPPGYKLAAQVDYIKTTETPISTAIGDGVTRYIKSNSSFGWWFDARADQFMAGESSQTRIEAEWLVDIEPMLL